MSYDRFLTRVWDKEDKKMLYYGDEVNSKRPGDLLGVTNDSLILCNDCSLKEDVRIVKFGDRFIPMQCTGDKINKKLLWESDIITAFIHSFTTDRHEEMIGKIIFGLKERLGFVTPWNYYTRLEDITLNDCKIIGNIHENEKLLEVKK